MPGYGDIGGSWRELNGGGYANIGGSWRQISEGYQNRGGVWEKVFPNYADYGDIVDMFGQNMITYGYWRYASSNSDSRSNGGLHTGISSGTSDSRSSSTQYSQRCYLSDPDGSSYWYGDCDHWFPTQQTVDLRAYNYLAAYIRPWYSYGSKSNYATPFFAIGTSATSIPSKDDSVYKLGEKIRSTETTQGTACPFYLFVDLSNCSSDSVYLKVGAYLSSTLSSTTCWGYINSSLIYLYKNKSDCDIDPGSTNAQYLSY